MHKLLIVSLLLGGSGPRSLELFHDDVSCLWLSFAFEDAVLYCECLAVDLVFVLAVWEGSCKLDGIALCSDVDDGCTLVTAVYDDGLAVF